MNLDTIENTIRVFLQTHDLMFFLDALCIWVAIIGLRYFIYEPFVSKETRKNDGVAYRLLWCAAGFTFAGLFISLLAVHLIDLTYIAVTLLFVELYRAAID